MIDAFGCHGAYIQAHPGVQLKGSSRTLLRLMILMMPHFNKASCQIQPYGGLCYRTDRVMFTCVKFGDKSLARHVTAIWFVMVCNCGLIRQVM